MTRLRWVFVTPTLSRPTGGDIAVHELASALAEAQGGGVHLIHVPFRDERVRSLGDVPWARFHPEVEHTFAARLDPDDLPAGDVAVHTMKLVASALERGAGRGRQMLEALTTDAGERGWLPVLFLQGHGVFGHAVEDHALRLPGAKVCVGSALAEVAAAHGVDRASITAIPNGVDHSTFRIVRALDARSPLVAMNYDPHPVKGGEVGLAALTDLHRSTSVPAVAFGTTRPETPLPDGVRFVDSPGRRELAERVYNEATAFLQPSQREGFGMCAVEAMASGCALVTTANGGSDEYAHHEETALVCDGDRAAMTDSLARLAGDDALRVRLAAAGARFVARFRWETSAAQLTRFVEGQRGVPRQ